MHFKQSISLIIIISFAFTSVMSPRHSYSSTSLTKNVQFVLNLPSPGQRISLSNTFFPTVIKGIKIFPDNPLRFNFIVDTGDTALESDDLKKESVKLIKYFLASLTIPKEEMWVNLSPYEKNRIIPHAFGETEMGRDLLAQDYILKQLTASLMYPENELGEEFWNKIYKKSFELYGTTEIPVNTFNKVWIIPEKAGVYTTKNFAFVMESHLKVMLEEDYVAMSNQKNIAKSRAPAWDMAMANSVGTGSPGLSIDKPRTDKPVQLKEGLEPSPTGNDIANGIIREIIIPAIEKEVNQGKNFAQLRQIYHSMILATWFKRNLQQSMLGKAYVNQNKTAGIDVVDKKIKLKIYHQYLEAFKKGVFNYIREEYDPHTRKIEARKYFSGGIKGMLVGELDEDFTVEQLKTQAKEAKFQNISVILNPLENKNAASRQQASAPLTKSINDIDNITNILFLLNKTEVSPEDLANKFLHDLQMDQENYPEMLGRIELDIRKLVTMLAQGFGHQNLRLLQALDYFGHRNLELLQALDDFDNNTLIKEQELFKEIVKVGQSKPSDPLLRQVSFLILLHDTLIYFKNHQNNTSFTIEDAKQFYEDVIKPQIGYPSPTMISLIPPLRNNGFDIKREIDITKTLQSILIERSKNFVLSGKPSYIYLGITLLVLSPILYIQLGLTPLTDYYFHRKNQEYNKLLHQRQVIFANILTAYLKKKRNLLDGLSKFLLDDLSEKENYLENSKKVERLLSVFSIIGSGYPPPGLATQEEMMPEKENMVNISIAGQIAKNVLSFLEEGSKAAKAHFILMSIRSIQVKRINDKDIAMTTSGLMFREGQPVFVDFKKPIPLHYIFTRDDFFQHRLRKTGIPIPYHSMTDPYISKKDIAAMILDNFGEDIHIPETLALIVSKIGERKFNRRRKQGSPHVKKLYLNPTSPKLEKKVRAVLIDFLNDNNLKKAVIKPNEGSLGQDVHFLNHKNISEKLEDILLLLRSEKNILLQRRITPPLIMKNGELLDWNLRVYTSIDENNEPIVSDTVVRIGQSGTAVNLSLDATPLTLNEIGDLLHLSPDKFTQLKEVIQKAAEQSHMALAKAMIKDKVIKNIAEMTDFIGMDIMVTRNKDEKFKAYIIEVDGHYAGGMWALDNHLKNLRHKGIMIDPDSIGRSTRDWVKTAIRKAQKYASTLPEIIPVLEDNHSSEIDDTREPSSSSPAKGGIDLNPDLLDLQIKHDSSNVPRPVFQHPIETMNIQGFLPVIINVTPVTNFIDFLGLTDKTDDSENISFRSPI